MEIFKDLKVIELAGVLAGPAVGMFFAELGAEVIKIENPKNPDVTRTWKIETEDKSHAVSAYFSSINYRKKYVSLDLKNQDDLQEVKHLIQKTDILISNFKKGSAEKLGLSDEEILRINPQIIHGKISGFGSNSDRVAYDLIIQAESGYMSMNGDSDSLPTKMPVALIDVLTAHQLKEGILCALIQRNKTQKGATVEASLYDTAVASLVNQASAYLMENKIPTRIGSKHPSIAPYGEIFTTSDHKSITFAIGSDYHFDQLLSYLKLDNLKDDNHFITNQNRVINRVLLAKLLQEKITHLSSNEIATWAVQHYVPCGIIKNLEEVFQEESAQHLIREEVIDGKKTKRVTGNSFQIKD